MPGAGDEMAARRSLRASDADRDQAVDVLKAAFVHERLAKDEFDLRVGQALAAWTFADLDALTAGIATGPPPPRPTPADRRGVLEFSSIARMIRTRRRLISLATGLLLLFAGVALPSTVTFISGMLVVASAAPQALPCTPESATIRTWQWLHRRQAGHPNR